MTITTPSGERWEIHELRPLPIPRGPRYEYQHAEYDGPTDGRCGVAHTYEEAVELILEHDEARRQG